MEIRDARSDPGLGDRGLHARLARAEGAESGEPGANPGSEQLGPRSVRPAPGPQPRAVPRGGRPAGRRRVSWPRLAPRDLAPATGPACSAAGFRTTSET